MEEDGISSKGNGEPKERSPARRRDGGSRLPPAKKLMHDAIRGRENEGRRWSGHDEAWGSGHAKDNEGMGDTCSLMVTTADGKKATVAAARHDFKFGDNQVSDALLARLSELGASAPRLVATKRLQSTDARANQNRLQLSGRSPLSRAFTDAERALLRTSTGMSVTAFDHRGCEYKMTCKLWKNDKHYRFMREGWKRFREAHHLTIANEARLTRRVTVELWAFRSRALPPPPAEEDCGHPYPDGVLGLVMLLREDGGEQEEAVDEEPAAAARARGRQVAGRRAVKGSRQGLAGGIRERACTARRACTGSTARLHASVHALLTGRPVQRARASDGPDPLMSDETLTVRRAGGR
uniref:TF-B3 domain-containing protein n=2 Tax=Setaria TaxID=4554 RepID=K3XQP6_SETIT|nr:hypothetical protein SEVIR_5G315200v2 [Setaria viridis]